MESLRRREFIRACLSSALPPESTAAAASYNPAAKFGVKVSEVEYRRTIAGRQLMARIYEPVGTGPFSNRSRSSRRRVERKRPPG